MSRARVAPTLREYIESTADWGNDDSPEISAQWRAELRALLACVRTMEKFVVLDGSGGCTHPAGMKEYAIPMAKALYRLSRVSRKGERR